MPDAPRFRVRGANTVTRRDEVSPRRPYHLKSLRFADLVAERDALRALMKHAKASEMFR